MEDGGGAIAVPGLVEAHTHLDKSLIGLPWYRNEVGPRLIDKIDNERLNKRRLNMDPYVQSFRQTVQSSGYGTTHIRTHIDVDTDHGLWGIEGVMKMREECRDIMDVEIVAFPQSGLLRRPGTLELMDSAMKAGAEVVGGLDPCAIDRDPKGHLDASSRSASVMAAPSTSICTSPVKWAHSRPISSSSGRGRSAWAAR